MKFKIAKILAKIDSTNSYLKKNIDSFKNGDIVMAKTQTMGRGRFNRVWEDNSNSSILASILIKDISPKDALVLTFSFSLALKNLLINQNVSPYEIKLKWPNDILVRDKKIAGILSEYQKNSIVIGIGMNIKNQKLSPKTSKLATNLEKESHQIFNIDEFRKIFVEEINIFFQKRKHIKWQEYPQIWFAESKLKGHKITVNREKEILSGHIIDISSYGELILLVDKKEYKINSGDIITHDKF